MAAAVAAAVGAATVGGGRVGGGRVGGGRGPARAVALHVGVGELGDHELKEGAPAAAAMPAAMPAAASRLTLRRGHRATEQREALAVRLGAAARGAALWAALWAALCVGERRLRLPRLGELVLLHGAVGRRHGALGEEAALVHELGVVELGEPR